VGRVGERGTEMVVLEGRVEGKEDWDKAGVDWGREMDTVAGNSRTVGTSYRTGSSAHWRNRLA